MPCAPGRLFCQAVYLAPAYDTPPRALRPPDSPPVWSFGNGALQDDNDALQDDNGALQDGNGALQDGNGVLQDGNGVLQDDNGALQDDNGVLQDDNGALQDDNGVLRDGNGALQDGNGVLQHRFFPQPPGRTASGLVQPLPRPTSAGQDQPLLHSCACLP